MNGSVRGFSLVEMAVALLILGMLLAFSVPAFQTINKTNQLHGATENMAANIRVLREKAIGTGQSQTLHFTIDYPPGTKFDYHVHNGLVTSPAWELPNDVTYWSIGINPTFDKTGRTTPSGTSGMVILRNGRGERDTVNILASGMVIVQ
jgi:prepilin-type N-terminal cleavage/methylation domain-containing protein